MKVYSREVADLLLTLFTTSGDDADCKHKVCGTLFDLDSALVDPKLVGGDTLILVACVYPSREAGLQESGDSGRQFYDVPVFALQKVETDHPSKPWEVKQALANLLEGKLDPWARLQERKRLTDGARPVIAEGVTLNAAALVGGGYDSIPELLAAGWYVCDVTVRVELGVPRT